MRIRIFRTLDFDAELSKAVALKVIVKTKIFDEFHGNGFTADEFGPDVGKNEIPIDYFRGVDRDREVARLALKQRYFDKESFIYRYNFAFSRYEV